MERITLAFFGITGKRPDKLLSGGRIAQNEAIPRRLPMLDLKLIRENPELIREALRKRQIETDIVDQIIALDEQRRTLILEVESKKA
ncbi:MAG TPA: hypothetical protein PK273_05255, partial [Anaerolineaceae bacterium]|nr:hypothetical protein [Anaerolineaceae bacterium]